MEKLSVESLDITQENINKIKELFPNVVTEGKIDFEALKTILGEEIDDKQEKYQFTWNGKRDAIRLAQMPSTGTLRPDKESSKDWDTTENLYIEGDNLEVLKLLQKSYYGKIKMIYIDPPYNTGGDFVYKDDFKDSIKNYKEQTQQTQRANPETSGRYHTDWLNMMYPRLMLARNLLTDDGAIFISIDENEFTNLIKICNEIFGENNFISNLIWKSKSGGGNDSKYFAVDHEYILVYAKNSDFLELNLDKKANVTTSYNRSDVNGNYSLDRLDKQSIRYSKSLDYEIIGPNGESYFPKHKDSTKPNATWRWSKTSVQEKYDELVFENGNVYTKNYQKEGSIPRTLLVDERFGRTRTGKTDLFQIFNNNYFSSPKPLKIINFLLEIMTNKKDIILDFFSGSATTAHAVMKLNAEDEGNRKFIMVQLPELLDEKSEAFNNGYKSICEIGKERIKLSGNQIIEESRKEETLFVTHVQKNKLDIGFKVFKLDNTNFYVHDSKSSLFVDLLTENTFDLERSNLDILYEIMIKYGVFDKPVESLGFDGKSIFSVAKNYMLVVIDENMVEKDINKIIELKPEVVIFDERCFNNDNEKINIEIRLKAAGINEVKSI